MEFTCLKENLIKGVQAVERVVATRSTLPIIGNILFEAKSSGLKISANNLEIGIEIEVAAKVIHEGSILIPARTLGGIVSKLPEGEIKFTVKDKGLINIHYKKSHFNLHGLPADEFPQLPKVKESKLLILDAQIFSNMLSQTLFAASASEEKYVLNGALLEAGKSSEASNVRLVATDGYRLAKRGAKVENHEGDISVIIPGKALSELSRILSGVSEGEVKIISSSDQIAFRYKDYFLVSRLIQGQFPDYKRVIPKNLNTKIIVLRKALLEASERCGVIASQSANIVKIDLRADSLNILAQAPDVGSVEEVVEVEAKGKNRVQVAFNVRLLIDALKTMDSEKVAFELGGPLDPGMLSPVNEEDYVYIVMPIKTQEVVPA